MKDISKALVYKFGHSKDGDILKFTILYIPTNRTMTANLPKAFETNGTVKSEEMTNRNKLFLNKYTSSPSIIEGVVYPCAPNDRQSSVGGHTRSVIRGVQHRETGSLVCSEAGVPTDCQKYEHLDLCRGGEPIWTVEKTNIKLAFWRSDLRRRRGSGSKESLLTTAPNHGPGSSHQCAKLRFRGATSSIGLVHTFFVQRHPFNTTLSRGKHLCRPRSTTTGIFGGGCGHRDTISPLFVSSGLFGTISTDSHLCYSVLVFMSTSGKGFQVPYTTITLHAISRSDLAPSIYCQLDEAQAQEEEPTQDEEAELEMRELRIIPSTSESCESCVNL